MGNQREEEAEGNRLLMEQACPEKDSDGTSQRKKAVETTDLST